MEERAFHHLLGALIVGLNGSCRLSDLAPSGGVARKVKGSGSYYVGLKKKGGLQRGCSISEKNP
jgi:hypothetical protein